MTIRSDDNIGTPAGKGAPARGLRILAAGGALALLLAGCASESESFRPGCPNVGVLRDAGTFRLLDAQGQLQGVAVLSDIQAICEYSDTGVTVRATLAIRGTPAEGADPGRIPVEYFVAVTDPNRNILARQTFATGIDVPGGQTGFALEDLVQFIPAPRTIDARWYEVLIGFQLPPEQVETNRIMNER